MKMALNQIKTLLLLSSEVSLTGVDKSLNIILLKQKIDGLFPI